MLIRNVKFPNGRLIFLQYTPKIAFVIFTHSVLTIDWQLQLPAILPLLTTNKTAYEKGKTEIITHYS